MACSYDTQTVLEMLFDIDTDNGINNDRIRVDSNHEVVVVMVAGMKCVIKRSHFNIRKVR